MTLLVDVTAYLPQAEEQETLYLLTIALAKQLPTSIGLCHAQVSPSGSKLIHGANIVLNCYNDNTKEYIV